MKLAQAKDKARRERRAVRQGRPLTAKPAMQSTLTAKSKARLDAMRAARPASAAAAGSAFDRRVERPPPVKYDPNKQFHSSAKLEFGRDDRAFAPRGRPGEGVRPLSAAAAGERGGGSGSALASASYKRYVFGGGPGKQSRERSEKATQREREERVARAKRANELAARRRAKEDSEGGDRKSVV